jgi:hypothetical protein
MHLEEIEARRVPKIPVTELALVSEVRRAMAAHCPESPRAPITLPPSTVDIRHPSEKENG